MQDDRRLFLVSGKSRKAWQALRMSVTSVSRAVFLAFPLLVILIDSKGISAGSSYRISEINCNGNVAFAGLQYEPFEPFIEIEAVCTHFRVKRGDPPIRHELSDYHIVIWDRDKRTTRLVVPLFSGYSDTMQIAIGRENFSHHGSYDEAEMQCSSETGFRECSQWLPPQNFRGESTALYLSRVQVANQYKWFGWDFETRPLKRNQLYLWFNRFVEKNNFIIIH